MNTKLPSVSFARAAAVALVIAVLAAGHPDAQLPSEIVNKVDEIVRRALTETGPPSASVAVVKGRRVVRANAYGNARLDPATPARTQMCYSIFGK